MAAELKTYDPARCVITFGPAKIEGFGEEMISITFPVMFTRVEGVDGEVARGKSNASALDIELTLLQTSLSNDVLAASFTLDVAAPSGAPLPFFFSDLDGGDFVIAPGAWVVQTPQLVNKGAPGMRKWKIHTGPSQYKLGGHVKVV
jgi:hypothetical protein